MEDVITSKRVILFIDHQNMYKGARDAFFSSSRPHFTAGQFNPVKMGELICSLPHPPPGSTRRLEQVRIYTGQPDNIKQPNSYAASRKQFASWVRQGVKLFPRKLRYPSDFPANPPKEKGVDVALSIDFVALAIDGAYDVGIIASTDTDMVPALEFVIQRFHGNPCVEVTAWHGEGKNYYPRLSSKTWRTWCHWLKKADYEAIHDPKNYTQS